MAIDKSTVSGRIFDSFNYVFLAVYSVICIYPFWYIFVYSLSNPMTVTKSLMLIPKGFTFFNYQEVFEMKGLSNAVGISVLRTSIGAFLSMVCNGFLAYGFTNSKLPARRILYRFVIITMYVSGGLIPTYLVFRSYGLINNFLVYIIPGAVSAFNIILVKTYIENSIPPSLEESAVLDGAGYITVFFKIIFPLCIPIIATIGLFSAVGHWNSWFDNMIYCQNAELTTLQYLLYKRLNEASQLAAAARNSSIQDIERLQKEMQLTPDAVRMTITIIVTLPILLVYPFVQRFFTKGIMIGAVKA